MPDSATAGSYSLSSGQPRRGGMLFSFDDALRQASSAHAVYFWQLESLHLAHDFVGAIVRHDMSEKQMVLTMNHCHWLQ